MLKAGILSHIIRELKQSSGKEQPKKKGETSGKEKPQAILMIQSRQRAVRQKITQSFSPDLEISFPSLGNDEGIEGPLIIEAEIGGHQVHRMCIDKGSSFEILYEHCFNQLRPEIRNQMVPATTSLVGFNGEIKWPLGQITLLMKVGDDEHLTSTWMDFMVVRSTSPFNGIIGRPGLRKMKAVPSTTHGMIKFPVRGGTLTLRSSKIIPIECAMISGPEDQPPPVNKVKEERIKVAINPKHPEQTVMIGSDLTEPEAEHKLNVRKGCQPVRQKKRGQAAERNIAINDEVSKLVTAGIMREVHYHDWLSNPVMVKKSDNSWRMCVDFKDLNKACPKDGYPLPEIDWKVESLCGFPFKCFLDAYKGYHQIQMAEEDEEKTAFITNQGIFCYTKMPFGLRNAGATYQRLVDKTFHGQIGRNLERIVDKTHYKGANLVRNSRLCGCFRYKKPPEDEVGSATINDQWKEDQATSVKDRRTAPSYGGPCSYGNGHLAIDGCRARRSDTHGSLGDGVDSQLKQVPKKARTKKADAISKLAITSFEHLKPQMLVEDVERKILFSAVHEREGTRIRSVAISCLRTVIYGQQVAQWTRLGDDQAGGRFKRANRSFGVRNKKQDWANSTRTGWKKEKKSPSWDQSHGISGSNAMLVFKDKMKHLKSNIQLWARKFNASKSEEKVQLSSKIGDIERDLEAGDIKDIFREFFVEKFKHFEGVDVTRRSDHYKTLYSAQVSLLEHSISEREVYDAIRDCDSEKSPGCNSSFITLIPKVDNPLVVSDFRPISLIGAQYKILAKILANRLSCVIDSVISPEQAAFIKTRKILDGPLMTVLWVSWVSGVVGEVLSPFLFILLMEALHVAFEDAINVGLYRGVQVRSLHIPHLLFADDILFLGEWSRSNIIGLVSLRQCFHDVSGLKINLHKSNLYGIGVNTHEISNLASFTGCTPQRLPFTSTLITSVLGSLVVYYLSLFPMPKLINKRLESLRANFFRGCTDGIKKIPWIAWNSVLASKVKGGLGIGSLEALNLALL
ncbi:reverse transcriptase domain-containing protein [Tanacetum coccineum]